MATKDRRKLQHIHSSIADKQPTPQSLEVGEIAVNNSADKEFLSLKNSNDKVVRFSSDSTLIDWIENKEVIPYKGYVRGETGPSATSGDSPSADTYGSYGITDNDLLTNKSNIIVKINQVAAKKTVKYNKINAAKDLYNKDVNPSENTPTGKTDGAGFFIDMSRYAMQGANPTFSGITNTCYTNLNGTTKIKGLNGACGSLLDITVNSAKTDIETANTEITSATTVIGTNSTTISGNTTLNVSGTTTETKKDVVIENNLSAKTENTTGVLTENNRSNHILNTTGRTNITRTDVVTEDNKNNVVRTTSGTTTETFKGQVTENNQSGYTVNTTGNVIVNTTGATTETKKGNVTENHSGTTTENYAGKWTVNVTSGTEITSCSSTTINTNNFKLTQCEGTSGTAEFDFCGGYKINTDKMEILQCSANGTMDVKEKAITVSGTSLGLTGTNLTIRENGATDFSGNTLAATTASNANINVKGNLTEAVTGTTNETHTGAVTITNSNNKTENTTGSHSIYSTGNTCINSQASANFYGKVSTNIGVACDGTKGSATTVYGTTTTISGVTTSVTGATTLNLSGNTINERALTAKTNVTSAYTSASTATLTGTNLTINETNTTINSCGKIEVTTDKYTLKQCSTSGGSAEFEFCNGYTVKSNAINLQQCGTAGTINITSQTQNVNGGNLTVKESGNTAINTSGTTNIKSSGNTNIETNGANNKVTIQASGTGGDVEVFAKDTLCESGVTAAFNGTTKTNIGMNCSDAGNTAELNVRGVATSISAGTLTETVTGATNETHTGAVTINNGYTKTETTTGAVTENNKNGYAVNTTGDTCIQSTVDVNVGGAANTNIGTNCNDSVKSNYVNINAKSGITEVSDTIRMNATDYIEANAKKIWLTASEVVDVGDMDSAGTSRVNIYGDDEIWVKSNNSIDVDTKDYDLDASNNVCINASAKANFYGNQTNIGIECGGAIATDTTIKGTTVGISGGTTNVSGGTINISGGSITEKSTGNTCITADGNLTIGGNLETNVGYNCAGTGIANNTKIYASTAITLDAPSINISGHVYGLEDLTIQYGTDVSNRTSSTTYDGSAPRTVDIPTTLAQISYNYVVDSSPTTTGGTISIKKPTNITGKLNVTGDTTINGNTTVTGTTTLKATTATSISASTEVKSPSISGTNTSAGTLTVTGNTKLEATTAKTLSATSVSATTISGSNITASGAIRANNVSADTISATTFYGKMSKKLTWEAGKFSADTEGYNGSANKTITVPTAISHLTTRGKLTVTHNGLSDTYDPATDKSMTLPHSALTITYGTSCGKSGTVTYDTSSKQSITIPTTVSNLGRATLKYEYGSVTGKSSASNGTYDPGEKTACAGEVSDTIVIPTSVKEMKNWNGSCYNFDSNVCVTGNLSTTGGVYYTSDERLKENIYDADYFNEINANNVKIKEFNFKDDETKRKVYGVTAQDVLSHNLGNLVLENENGFYSVDYTSLMLLKIAFLENEVRRLEDKLNKLS